MVDHRRHYVLLTAACNEERFITRTIEAVIAQTQRPARWVIASDGSTDRTDEIVRGFCSRYEFIELLHVAKAGSRGVPSKVRALQLGCQELKSVAYELIGNLDADVSVGADYYERLCEKFLQEPKLGIAGGLIFEEKNGKFQGRLANSLGSVAHAAQLVRRECYEAIGGYRPLKYGGEDWCAEINARMRGWTARTFPELQVMHLRATGGADPWLRHRFREGRADYSLGSNPTFEIFKCLRRVPEEPLLLGAVARLVGFAWSYFRQEERLVPEPIVRFLQNEQRERLRQLFARPAALFGDD